MWIRNNNISYRSIDVETFYIIGHRFFTDLNQIIIKITVKRSYTIIG